MNRISKLRSFVDFENQYVSAKQNEKVSSKGKTYTTMALGEEGGSKVDPEPKIEPRFTTMALGEEGGSKVDPEPKTEPRYTTMALGEEGGGITDEVPDEKPVLKCRSKFDNDELEFKPKIDPKEHRYTTMAVGEEGGGTVSLMESAKDATGKHSFIF